MRTRDYRIRFPRDVTIPTACEDVDCDNRQFGWETVLDERTPQGRDLAAWLRSGASGRTFRELRAGEVTAFRFDRGQRCFEEHRTRPATFLAGAHRVATLGDWIGDLDDHVNRLETQLRKG